MTSGDRVRVVFVDAGDGSEIGRADVPADQLPADFTTDTTLDLGGAHWAVERAEPPTAAEYIRQRGLVLTLRRIEFVAPTDVLFSLPTICDDVPATAVSAEPQMPGYTIHEDDWRQVELVDAALADVVHEELAAIKDSVSRHAKLGEDGRLIGFRHIYLRKRPAQPLPRPIPLPPGERLGPLGIHGRPGVVPGSFAMGIGETESVLYGVAGVFGISGPVPDLRGYLAANGLIVVDWCGGLVSTSSP
jgi:hypothetical protein